MLHRILSLSILTLLPLLVTVGCGSAQKASGGLAGAMADYEKGDYRAAHEKAVAAIQHSTGVERDRASYIAGVSAYRNFDYVEAETRCSMAANSSDAQTAARAKATLGLTYLAQSRPAIAAEHLSDAARQLEGAESSEASYRAGLAYQLAGDENAARRSFDLARTSGGSVPGGGSTGASTPSSSSTVSNGMFAIQVGAFQDMENAQSAAGEARSLAQRHALGDVRIVSKTDSRGRTLYVVQIGEFGTRYAAESALRRTGQNRYIVAPMNG